MGDAESLVVMGFRNERKTPVFRHTVSIPHEAYARAGMGPHGGQWDKVWSLMMQNTPDLIVILVTKRAREDLEEQVRELRKQLKKAKTELAVRG